MIFQTILNNRKRLVLLFRNRRKKFLKEKFLYSQKPQVAGPREGFVETLAINTSLLRRKIKSPALKMQSMKIGRYTNTHVVIAYVEGITNQTLIEEVKNRLQLIEIDSVLESGYIE